MKAKILALLAFLAFLPYLVEGRNFIVYNISNPSQTYFAVNGTTGYVGVGTINPAYALDVVGKGRFSTGLILSSLTSCGKLYTDASGNVLCGTDQQGVTGSGTTNYIPIWTGSTILGNSVIYQNGSNIGIGTTNPQGKLDVNGEIHGRNGYGWDIYIGGDNGGNDLEIGSTSSSATTLTFWNRANANKINIVAADITGNNLYAKNLYLNQGQNEGSIYDVDIIKGYNDIRFRLGTNSYFYFQDSGGNTKAWIDYNGNGYFASSLKAPIFYDSDNTGYYLNPASTGDSVHVAGSIRMGLGEPGGSVPTFNLYAKGYNSTNIEVQDRATWYMNVNASWVDKRTLSLWYYPGDSVGGCCHHLASFGIKSDGSNYVYLVPKVGIGTTNPQQALDVNGNINLANNAKLGFNNDLSDQPRSIKLRSGYSGDEVNAGTIAYRPSWDSGALAIVGAGTTSSNRRVRIWDSLSIGYGSAPSNGIAISGSMGIGTSSPISSLDVRGVTTIGNDRSSSGFLRILGTGGINYIESALNTSTGSSADLRFTDMNAANTWMTIKSNGNVGIGTNTPSAKLEVNGNIKLSSSNPVINLNGMSIKKVGDTIVISDTV